MRDLFPFLILSKTNQLALVASTPFQSGLIFNRLNFTKLDGKDKSKKTKNEKADKKHDHFFIRPYFF